MGGTGGSPDPIDPARAVSYMSELAGTWEGRGHGGYPTIDPFDYREELRFTKGDGGQMFRYVVRSWRIEGEREVPSHQETGFMTVAPDGSIESLNAQGADRVEVLRGTISADADGSWALYLESTLHGGDPRMRSASRIIEVSGDALSYTLHMSTDRVDASELHLKANLRRVVDGG